MRLLFLAAAALVASAPGPAAAPPADAAAQPPRPLGTMPVLDPSPEARADCPPISRYHATQRGGPLAARKLNELPAADLYKSVYRRVGGCEVPIIAGYGYGLPSRGQRSGE
jgi:hypothetical protein